MPCRLTLAVLQPWLQHALADSHIDYMMISEASATSVRRFGIHANPDLCKDRGGRHAALFIDVDVVSVLGVAKPQQPAKAQGRF